MVCYAPRGRVAARCPRDRRRAIDRASDEARHLDTPPAAWAWFPRLSHGAASGVKEALAEGVTVPSSEAQSGVAPLSLDVLYAALEQITPTE